MDGLIKSHYMKQKTRKDFAVSFKFNEPIKHLPKELKEINEVKQYLLKNGIDENEAQKYIIRKDDVQNIIKEIRTKQKPNDSIDS